MTQTLIATSWSLQNLTEEIKEEVDALNAAYYSKHGYPLSFYQIQTRLESMKHQIFESNYLEKM
jgi:2-oxo-4-hydroxy-4-carboxy--5-ureidoimidazoline (OHCU) decarboxylase